MPELGPYGSVRGAAGDSRPYRERLHDDPNHVRRQQAYEKRQDTKSRLVGQQRRSALYGDLAAVGMETVVDGAGRSGRGLPVERVIGESWASERASKRCLTLAGMRRNRASGTVASR
jgi:hypothetical protein